MSDFDLDHVVYLVRRSLLRIYDGSLSDHVQTHPTVFFGPAAGETRPSMPLALLKERKRRLDAHLYVSEWYLITESGSTEYTEELRGDYGVLIVDVDDVAAARKELT